MADPMAYKTTVRFAYGYTDPGVLRGTPAGYRDMILREDEQRRIDYQVAIAADGSVVPVMRWPGGDRG